MSNGVYMYYKQYKKYDDGNIYCFKIDGQVFIDTFTNVFRPVYLDGKISRYAINLMGNIYNTKKKSYHKMTPVISSGGYYRVNLMYKKSKNRLFSLHRLVALHFIDNPENKPDVNHKDGDKSHNYASNLEWCTKSENVKHAFAHDLNSNAGEMNPKSKLTETDVTEIWKRLNANDYGTMTDLGKLYGVSKETISNIFHGHSWKKLYDMYSTGYIDRSKKYNDATIKKAKDLIREGKTSMKDIFKITKIDLKYIYSLKLNKYRKDI